MNGLRRAVETTGTSLSTAVARRRWMVHAWRTRQGSVVWYVIAVVVAAAVGYLLPHALG